MIHHKNYFILCLIMLVASILFFAYHKEYLIITIRSRADLDSLSPHSQNQKVLISYWKYGSWHTETVSLLFSDKRSYNMQQLVSRWLQLLHEEKIIKKNVSLQSATMSFDNQELIISWDRAPWNKEMSTHEKWMIVESLLRTVKVFDGSIKKIRILMNQKPMQDRHLDFTNPWPIEGFLLP